MLSRLLDRHGVPHNVLNAKQHEREAEIIEDAGQQGAITIATNMAGRGVDIKLGEGVVEARRPVRARHRTPREPAHRQPAPRPLRPPGRPRRDALLPVRRRRAHPPVRRRPHVSASSVVWALRRASRIEAKMLSNVVEKAQKKVEELNFMRRKNVLKYDEVMNEQRRVIYDQRERILMGEDFGEQVREMIGELVDGAVRSSLPEVQYSEDWDLDALFIGLRQVYDPHDQEGRHRPRVGDGGRGRRARRRRRARRSTRSASSSSASSRCATWSAP